MFGIPNLFEYISGGLALMLVGTGIYNKIEVSGLENDVAKTHIELLECKSQSRLYKLSLDSQTEAIEALRVDYNASVVKLEEWKSKPAGIRYRTIYKHIPKIEYVKGDCNDTKLLIDSISTINYSDL